MDLDQQTIQRLTEEHVDDQREVRICRSALKAFTDTIAVDFQPGGIFHDETLLDIGESVIIGGYAWLKARYLALKAERDALERR